MLIEQSAWWAGSVTCEALDPPRTHVRAHSDCVLVLRREPGVGTSVQLKDVISARAGCRLFRATGVESEMELAIAGCISAT